MLALLLLAVFDPSSAGACYVYGRTTGRADLVTATVAKARAAREERRTVLAGRLFLDRVGQINAPDRERAMLDRGRAACEAIGVK